MKNKSVFIHNIDSKYNTGLFPVRISNSDFVDGIDREYSKNNYLTSQYSLEVKIHKFMSNYSNLTDNIDNCEIIYIPIYTFLLAWKQSYFYDVNEIINNLNELKSFIDHYSESKKILMVYSDVLWDDGRCFINHFNFNKNVFCVCYENNNHNIYNNQIPVCFVTHISCDPNDYVIPNNLNRNNLICYCGRYRKEQDYIKNIKILDVMKYQEVENQWISYNNFYANNEIDNLYENSTFSLQPHGDRETRKGFYQSLLLGCIPVIFENNFLTYKKVFEDHIHIEELCIIIKNDQIDNIETILNSIDNNKIENIINNYNKIKPLLLYNDNNMEIVKNILSKIN